MGFNFLSKRYAKIKSVICVNENIAKIDINQADERALMDIPGIGEKISRRIIDQRTEQSGFSDIEELKKIKGMTHYRYKKLKEYFYVK
jgi:DNA uptake protein ComE-like DNA-binding protein